MTNEELGKLAAMPVTERIRKYFKLIGKPDGITRAQYDFIVSLGGTGEASPEVSHNPHATEQAGGGDTTVASLIDAFGGYEVKDTPMPGTVADFNANSQKGRLAKLLQDGLPHDTIEIQRVVYGADHLGVARIASRIDDLRNEGWDIRCEKKAGTIWQYTHVGWDVSKMKDSTLKPTTHEVPS